MAEDELVLRLRLVDKNIYKDLEELKASAQELVQSFKGTASLQGVQMKLSQGSSKEDLAARKESMRNLAKAANEVHKEFVRSLVPMQSLEKSAARLLKLEERRRLEANNLRESLSRQLAEINKQEFKASFVPMKSLEDSAKKLKKEEVDLLKIEEQRVYTANKLRETLARQAEEIKKAEFKASFVPMKSLEDSAKRLRREETALLKVEEQRILTHNRVVEAVDRQLRTAEAQTRREERLTRLEAERARRQGSASRSAAFLGLAGAGIGAMGFQAGMPLLNVGFATMSAQQLGLGAAMTTAMGATVGLITALGELARAGMRLQDEFKAFASSTFDMSSSLTQTRTEAKNVVDMYERQSIIMKGLSYEMSGGAKAAMEFRQSMEAIKLGFMMMGNDLIDVTANLSGAKIPFMGGVAVPLRAVGGYAGAMKGATKAEFERGEYEAGLKSLTSAKNFLMDVNKANLPDSIQKFIDFKKKLIEDLARARQLGLQSEAPLAKALAALGGMYGKLFDAEKVKANLAGIQELFVLIGGDETSAAKKRAERMRFLDSEEGQALSVENRSKIRDKIEELYDKESGHAAERERLEKERLDRAKRLAKQEEDLYRTRQQEAIARADKATSIHDSLKTEEERFRDRIEEINELTKTGAYPDLETAASDMLRTAFQQRKDTFKTEFIGIEELNRKISSMTYTAKDKQPSKEDIEKVEKAISDIYGPKGLEAFKKTFQEAMEAALEKQPKGGFGK